MEDIYFINAIKGKNKPFATIKEGFEDLKLVAAVVESSENDGKVVRL